MVSRELNSPFAYPTKPHCRRHGPIGYKNHREFLNWLRDDFSFRCVYCLRRETWGALKRDWHIDHFVPVSLDPDKQLDYDNLVYACASCNQTKAAQIAPDPCKVAYGNTVAIDNDGKIEALDADGIALIETVGLDGSDYTRMRKLILSLFRDTAGLPSFQLLFGYPENLPDLTREPEPPGGNKRKEGIRDSHYERAKRDTTPSTY